MLSLQACLEANLKSHELASFAAETLLETCKCATVAKELEIIAFRNDLKSYIVLIGFERVCVLNKFAYFPSSLCSHVDNL
jgi:hypothetical protein